MRASWVFLSSLFFPGLLGSAVRIDESSLDELVGNPEIAFTSPPILPATRHKKLHGKFLHITDFHPDPFYRLHASTEQGVACHREQGAAGVYGAETSDCDSPFSLINATFDWISRNIRDDIDFVIWTGDSARHDSDEQAPRSAQQVLTLNNYLVSKVVETFADDNHDMTIPVIPTFGNNDILPHNILIGGPNKWLKSYTSVWERFIPEAQRHGFERGGWFYVEVIPGKLAVFSLNTMYFFDHNTAVDGCALRSEPGFEHMEWLRIQLQFMRDRGMKAIIMGHVPPARTDSKQLWDETCWQKYTLYLRQFRDVVVSGFFGHMNIDHFLLQDTKQIDILATADAKSDEAFVRDHLDDELSIQGATDYLTELRQGWSAYPDPSVLFDENTKLSRKERNRKKKAIKELGGPWAERFQVTNVAPSVVPNFFPSLRVLEYNLSGIETSKTWAQYAGADEMVQPKDARGTVMQAELDRLPAILSEHQGNLHTSDAEEELGIQRSRKGHNKKHKRPHHPSVVVPKPPDKTALPGPAYSAQTLTLLGYTQYYANLTKINNDFTPPESDEDGYELSRWNEGKHHNKHPKHKTPRPKKFKYIVEYSTVNDTRGYGLKDMTVRSYLELAYRIAQYEPRAAAPDDLDDAPEDLCEDVDRSSSATQFSVQDAELYAMNKKHHKSHKSGKRAWYTFVKRAFVAVMTDDEVKEVSLQPFSTTRSVYREL